MGLRKCNKCDGPGPCMWDDQDQRYLCKNCHSKPEDEFFQQEVKVYEPPSAQHTDYIVGYVIRRGDNFLARSDNPMGPGWHGWTNHLTHACVFTVAACDIVMDEIIALVDGVEKHPVILEHRGAVLGMVGERNQYRLRAKKAEAVIDETQKLLHEFLEDHNYSVADGYIQSVIVMRRAIDLLLANAKEFTPVPADGYQPKKEP